MKRLLVGLTALLGLFVLSLVVTAFVGYFHLRFPWERKLARCENLTPNECAMLDEAEGRGPASKAGAR